MTKKEINERAKVIRDLLKEDDLPTAADEFKSFAYDLHTDKQHSELLTEYFKFKKLLANSSVFYCFELAYAYNQKSDDRSSEIVYEYLLLDEPDNTSMLNNLSNIKKADRKYKEAFDLISKAYEIDPNDEIISNNYESLNHIILEEKERKLRFENAIESLEKENSFVINKLKSFLQAVKKDENYNEGVLPLAKWKFKVYMKTDEQKADSLREQWIKKEYISETGARGSYNEKVYEINPFIVEAINDLEFKTINEGWIKGIERLSIEHLEQINYFKSLKKINKINKKFKFILKRDFDELTLNYLIQNNKSTIILAGSLIETLLIYYLERNKVKVIEYEVNNKKVSKALYSAGLNDLLSYLEQKKMLQKQFVHLGNISRIFRNYVHPGKELKENDELDNSKANLCYISACEIINTIV